MRPESEREQQQPAPVLDDRGPDPHPAIAPDDVPPGTARVELAVDGTHAILWLSGEVDIASSTRIAEVGGPALADPRVASMTADFAGVTFLDSSGLGTIIELRKRAEAADKEFALRAVTPAVARIFSLTGLNTVFGLDNADDGRC